MKYVVFNSEVANLTPQSFNKYLLEKKGLKPQILYLEKLGNITDDYYLEFFGGWGKPKGKGKGFVIEVENGGK